MTAVELLPPDAASPDNPEWHALRRQGITASEIAAVCGVSPWESPFSLWCRKRYGWQVEQTEEMAAGHRAEPVILHWFAEQHEYKYHVLPAGLYAHPQRPWQIATPDALVYGFIFRGPTLPLLAALECKYLIGGWDGWGEPGSDDIPVHYRAQALWQLDTLDVDETHVAAWHGAHFRQYLIRRDDKDLRVMRQLGLEFLHRLAVDEPPQVDAHPATGRALRAVHPSIVDRDQEISPNTAEGYRRARALKARGQRMADLFEARLRAELGDARRAVSGGQFVASRSIYKREAHQVAASEVDRLNPARPPKGKP